MRYLLEQTITTEAQQKWLVKLMGYNFTIEYKNGLENSAANNLSCKEHQGLAMALLSPVPNWVKPIKEEISRERELQELVARIQQGEAIGP